MHIETLKIFCDLVEQRSFLKAAEKHLLSQSAVSQQIAQIELANNCQLFDRKKRPIELTRSGQLFYSAAQDILDRYERFKGDLATHQAAGSKRINVAAIYSIGMHSLPNYLKQFLVSYPKVNVHVEYSSASKIYELVLSGDIDIGLLAVPTKDKRLDVYEFENEPLVLVCSPRHQLANETEVDIHQVELEKFIGFDKAVPTRQWIDGLLQRYNIVVNPIMEFDNIETVKRAVEINAGISILPRMAILQERGSGTIRTVGFSNENFFRPTGIIVRKNKILSREGRYFIELLRKKS